MLLVMEEQELSRVAKSARRMLVGRMVVIGRGKGDVPSMISECYIYGIKAILDFEATSRPCCAQSTDFSGGRSRVFCASLAAELRLDALRATGMFRRQLCGLVCPARFYS